MMQIQDLVSAADFEALSMDGKLSQIFPTLTCNRSAITRVEQTLDAINKLNGRVSIVEKVVNSYNHGR